MPLDMVKELQPIGDAFKLCQYGQALAQLEELWERIPSPREAVLNSFLAVRYGVAIALKADDLNRASEWATRGLPYSGGFNVMGESEFLAGEVAFARSELEDARRYFMAAKKLSVRCFPGPG